MSGSRFSSVTSVGTVPLAPRTSRLSVSPPGTSRPHSTWYCVTAEPWSRGAFHETRTAVSPAPSTEGRGAGGVAAVRAFAGADHGPAPSLFTARTHTVYSVPGASRVSELPNGSRSRSCSGTAFRTVEYRSAVEPRLLRPGPGGE